LAGGQTSSATIILLLMTVCFNPSRLLVAFSVFLMFVAASLSFEALQWLVNVIGNAPKELAPPK
jgi:hypothetical protein